MSRVTELFGPASPQRPRVLSGPASPQRPRVLSGPAATKAAYALEKRKTLQELWPYTHLFPPPEVPRVRKHGTLDVATMTAGTQAFIVQYTVPTGFFFVQTHILRGILGATGFIPGGPTATWVLDVNRPIGVASVQGYLVNGFENDNIQLGFVADSAQFPYPLVQPQVYASLDLVQDKVTITADITAGIFYSALIGYLLPAAQQSK